MKKWSYSKYVWVCECECVCVCVGKGGPRCGADPQILPPSILPSIAPEASFWISPLVQFKKYWSREFKQVMFIKVVLFDNNQLSWDFSFSFY